MNEEELRSLLILKNDVDEILGLDVNFLREKMKEDPDEIIATLRAGFTILKQILDQAVSSAVN